MAKKILFVDDESDLRFMFATFFEMSGYEVVSAGNAEEAARLADGVPLGAIILDVSLPGAGSAKVLESVKRSHPGAHVILYTGRQEDDTLVRNMMALGAQSYVFKDGSLKGLLDAVKEICG